jgi:alpha-L-fucosidase
MFDCRRGGFHCKMATMTNKSRSGSRYFVRRLAVIVALGLGLVAPGTFAADEVTEATQQSFELPAKDSPDVAWWQDSMKTRDKRLAWWRDARFGMFIHWGVYSGLGNEYKGRQGGGYAEHIQRILKIPEAEYRREVAGTFDPTNFDADAWVRLARDAGMKYIVITAKHHDGFAMWPSKVSDYNIMDATPWHHDPMADLKAACQKYGLKFGFYYSHAFDWENPNAPGNDWDYTNPGGDKKINGVDWWNENPGFMKQARKYVDEKAIPQILELIRMYHPDILWFDTPGKLPPSENLRIMKAVRAADPNVVISGRLVHGWGDYDDTTDRPAEFPPHDGDWEGIPTTDESYGWNKFDTSHKPPSHFIQLIAKVAARGGNVLLNIGPMGDGTIDPKDVAILKGIGAWWQVNGESIRGTVRTPLAVQTWGESTRKGNTLYLHVFQWPANGTLIVGGLKSTVTNAYLLAGGEQGTSCPLPVRLNPLDVAITVPASAPDAVDSVVVADCEDPIVTDSARLLQSTFPTNNLRAFDGTLHGKGLEWGAGKKNSDYLIHWSKPEQFVTWPVRLNEAGTYEVTADYDASENSAGNTFTVNLGAQTLRGTVQSGNYQATVLGRVTLPPGTFEIKIAPAEIKGGDLMNLRGVVLKPVR